MSVRVALGLTILGVGSGFAAVATQVPDSRFRSGVAVAEVTAGLAPGDYILRVVAAHSSTDRVERRVPFEIVR